MVLTDAQRAYSQIRERIITTVMKPGSVIEEAELMAELGLGRTPIREALKLLEAERLVVVSPRRGMFVADVTLTDLRQIEEIRLELDTLCVRLAVQRMTSTQLEEMRRLVAELEQVAGQYSQADLLNLDRRFHALLREASHNRLLEAECKMLYNLSLRIWYLFVDRLTPETWPRMRSRRSWRLWRRRTCSVPSGRCADTSCSSGNRSSSTFRGEL